MTERFIKPFIQISKTDINTAGGKGASLGEMTQIGIPVPDGFVVLSCAFDSFIAEANLSEKINAILETIDIKNSITFENASEKIQAMIVSREIPENIASEILKFYKNLDCEFVAVRSSATSEDSATAAWAGQLDSFLNTSEQDLLSNVKRCRASLFTPRAIFYRLEKKLSKDIISVAVVVQKMVDSEESGVAFSVHPVTQDENQIIIEAGFGLGEAIVSGAITPNSYIVEKSSCNVLSVHIEEQCKALYRKHNGGNEWKELGEVGKKQVLTKKNIVELSKLIVKIEKHYGFPCDIEWVKEKGEFYIVQCRSITTLNKEGVFDTTISRFKKYFKDKEITKHEGSFSPLFWGTAASSIATPLFRKYYPEVDFGPILFMNKANKGIGFFNFNSYLICAEDALKRYLSGDIKEFNDIKDLSEKITTMYAYYSPCVLGGLQNKDLIAMITETFVSLQEIQIITLFCEALDETTVKKYFDLYNLDQKISLEDFFHTASLISFSSFFNKLDRALIEFDEANPYKFQWAFSDYMGAPKLEAIVDKNEELIKEKGGMDEIKKEVYSLEKEMAENQEHISAFTETLDPNLLRLFMFTHEAIKLRDLRKQDFFNCIVLLSNSVRELLKRIVIDESLFYYVIFSDIQNGLYLEKRYIEILHKRKRGNLYFFDETLYQELNIDYEKIKKEIFDYMDRDRGSELIGTVAQRGHVQGRAKIILDQSQFEEFNAGDILITSMTRPEFVPLMKKAKAIVTDEGGLTCHAAIISRELKKPCIVGTKNASRFIKNNDRIIVDANNGIVRIVEV